ncbi:unnamed protein product [Cyprideis torosa]|uniref:ethanolamine kinase n=1 Tax=Cyprideis torosa TaxID=163714 RepID=A0A7R8ZRM6_9CRUS|nr:unnamed protein product [Cyprideis torosa]CAG0899416.1 unnamed protein product [Cyprideis torosa]
MTLGRRVPEGLNFGVALNVNNIASEAIPLIRRIRPQWNLSEIKHKQFTTGITNKLYGFYTNSDPKDTLLFRVYGEKTDLFIDREREKRNMMILCEAGEAPLYYGSFMNGLIYEFVPGQTLTTVSVRDPDKDWIRIYLQEYNGTSDVADQEVNELFRLVGKFTLLSHLFWAVWAVLQSNFSRIDFDFLGYATIRYKRYLDTKDHYLAL